MTERAPEPAEADRLVAAEIRALLARRDLTHDALARRIGVTRPWVSRRLRGKTPFTVADVVRIARALDVPVAELVTTLDH